MKEKNKYKKQKKLMILLVILLFVSIIVAASFAYFQVSEEGEVNVIQIEEQIQLFLYNEKTVNVKDAMPMSDQYAMQYDHVDNYEFTISNQSNYKINYKISVEDITTTLPRSILRYSIQKNNDTPSNASSFNTEYIDLGTIDSQTDVNFKLKVWVDKDASTYYMDRIYSGKINIDLEQSI